MNKNENTLARLGMVFALAAVIAPGAALAGEREELLRIKNTIENLVDALVEQGVLTADKAKALKQEAEAKAAVENAKVAGTATEEAPAGTGEADAKVIRVPYVPEFVKDEIRQQVRAELRDEVLADVKQTAKTEKWGTPDALPAWVNRFEFYGDLRLRQQGDYFADKNAANTYPDFLAINRAGGVVAAGVGGFINTTQDRQRLRTQVRLGVKTKVADGLLADLRITTGNINDPISTNQSLGNYGRRYDIQLDHASLAWEKRDANGFPWLTVSGGRFDLPFVRSNLIFDEDLSMEGAAAKIRYQIGGDGDLYDRDTANSEMFLVFGASAIEEVELSDRDKWMLGAQIGALHTFDNQSTAKIAVGVYDFRGITGQRNVFGSVLKDFTAPKYLQRGNTLFNINNDGDPATQLFALASDYDILQVYGSVDLAQLAPVHVVLTGEFARNFGFNKDDIFARSGLNVSDQATAYKADITVGRPILAAFGDWQVFGGYRYVQRDAVLDAFTDSDFGLGGTDVKGYVLGGSLGLSRNAWVRGRWLSSDEIVGAPLGIDVFQLDLNTRF